MRVRARLDWIIDVRGTDDPDEAKEVAYNYVADQELEESVEYTLPGIDVAAEPGDDEVTVTLYPEGEVVPADEHGAWAAYEVQR